MRKLHENNDALIQLAEVRRLLLPSPPRFALCVQFTNRGITDAAFQNVDAKIYPAAISVVNETKNVEDFKSRLSTIPTIIASISHARKQIGAVKRGRARPNIDAS